MKWSDYYPVFDEYFPQHPDNILEIGSGDGSGLQYLRSRFPKANIYGVDYAPRIEACSMARHCKVKLYTLDQRKVGLLPLPPMDLVLDDGGHRPYQQLASFKALWPKMPDGGVYMIEDMHLNFRWHWRLYGKFFGIMPELRRMIAKQNAWTGTEELLCVRSPRTILFTPQLVTLVKGEVFMRIK